MGGLNLRALPWVHTTFCLMADRRRIILQLYSTIGGILLFRDGPFLFFTYPEWCAIVFGVMVFTLAHPMQANIWRNCFGSRWCCRHQRDLSRQRQF